jgi:hypothetical protein
LKIPKPGVIEGHYNTMAKQTKRTKGQTMIYKTETNDQETPTQLRIQMLRTGRQFLLHIWHPSCSTLVANPVVSHEWGKDRIVTTTNEIYPWSLFVTRVCSVTICIKCSTPLRTQVLRKGRKFLLHIWHPSCSTLVTNPVVSHE